MRLSELTNEMLSTYKYPNLMAEVKESTYSICTIAEHIGLGRYRKEDDSKVWSKLTGREEILYDEALGLARLFDTKSAEKLPDQLCDGAISKNLYAGSVKTDF